jgi:predicted HTH domain antitoxin
MIRLGGATVKTLEIQLPDQTVAGLDREPEELASDLRMAAAVKWYELGRVSQEVAAEVAGLSRSDFLSLLNRMSVSPLQETADGAAASARFLLEA